jgi:hypothetical protein
VRRHGGWGQVDDVPSGNMLVRRGRRGSLGMLTDSVTRRFLGFGCRGAWAGGQMGQETKWARGRRAGQQVRDGPSRLPLGYCACLGLANEEQAKPATA